MHWYDKHGNPRYDADMRTARKEGLLPSVTSIDNVIAAPGIEEYKIKQMFIAAQDVPMERDEPSRLYYNRVKAASKQHARNAAKLGTVIHRLIERYLTGKPLFFKGQRKDVWSIFDIAKRWIDENITEIEEVESVVVAPAYAGKADCICKVNGKPAIIDWKTTDPDGKLKKDGQPGKNKMFYPSHIRQLAALSCSRHKYELINVAISTNINIPGVWVKRWTREEKEKGLCEFHYALRLWYSINNYEVPA